MSRPSPDDHCAGLISLAEARERLGLEGRAFYDLIGSETLRACRCGDELRVWACDVDAYLSAHGRAS